MRRILVALLLLALAVPVLGYINATADPVVRRANVAFRSWPAGAPPVRVALLADIHVQGPDLGPERMARIAAQVNAQKPDLILIAGDFSGDRTLRTRLYSEAEIAASLTTLKAPLGVYAVLGNHDHWRDGPAMKRAVAAAGIPVLVNRAVRAGPLTIAGADDIHTRNADIEALTRSAAAAKFNLDTPVQDLVADAKAKAVLEANLPGISTHESYEMFKGMSLNQLSSYAADKLTPEVLAKTQKELAAVK